MSLTLRRLNAVGPSKVDQVVKVLEDEIVEGNLPVGSCLPSESELAEHFGVSKFCMREALRVLHVRGLIEISQGKRTRVIDTSVQFAAEVVDLLVRRSKHTLYELAEVRLSLERDIARHAAERATPDQKRRLAETIDGIESNRSDSIKCQRYDGEFHRILLEATNNKVYHIVMAPLASKLRQWQLDGYEREGAADDAVNGHKSILEAIIQGDAELADSRMRRHIVKSMRNLEPV